jgi:hypothetical protein
MCGHGSGALVSPLDRDLRSDVYRRVLVDWANHFSFHLPFSGFSFLPAIQPSKRVAEFERLPQTSIPDNIRTLPCERKFEVSFEKFVYVVWY